MLPVVDKPLIQYAVEEAANAGIEEFIFVTGRGKSAIEDHFDHAYELQAMLETRGKKSSLKLVKASIPNPGQIAYIRQQEPLGLGHAVWCARNFVGSEPVAILLADDLIHEEPGCLKQMIDTYKIVGGNMLALAEVSSEDVSSYGIIEPEEEEGDTLVKVKGLVEKPNISDAPSNLAIIGRYILQPQIFETLNSFELGAGGEIQLTDAIARQIGDEPLYGFRFKGQRFDCGSQVGFLEANISLALDRPELKTSILDFLQKISRT